MQQLCAKESDILLPDTLEVEVKRWMKRWREDSQNVHLVEAADKGTEKDRCGNGSPAISGINLETDEEQSDLPEFNGGIS